MTTKPTVLIILDGWGVSQPSIGNAVTLGEPKYWDYLLKNYPAFLLQASGEASGLPYGEVGNSEVGHMTIGSGQIILQSLNRINRAILDRSFEKNKALLMAVNHTKKNNSAIHLIGLLGNGGIHAHQAHLESLIKFACDQKVKNVYIHLFLDGRDTPKDKGIDFIMSLQKTINIYKCGQIATLSGRSYGMDRNNNWDKIKTSYDAMVHGKSNEYFEDAELAIRASYAKNIYDEEFKPVVIISNSNPVGKISSNDAVIFFNFRADRARELTNALVSDNFSNFDRGEKLENLLMITFTEYQKGLPVEVAFPRPNVSNTLSEVVSKSNFSQLHLAETEKYAHVTFFFNGLREEKFTNEERILVPSPFVETYDLCPQMSASEVTDNLINNIEKDKFDFYVVNFANADMVGHTGNLAASIKAIQELDNDLAKIIPLILEKNGSVIITADHGNVEEVVNLKTGEIDKEHSCFPVPLILVDNRLKNKTKPIDSDELYKEEISGVLSDIAPTVLSFLGLKSPKEMMGINLARKFKI
jgi:2,3-bisphosphoglycerate-independent phosphoglycerate mutase